MPKATGSGDPHAWFIGFIRLPGEEPRYAVAIVLEAGGGGGQVALPIGRDLLVAAMGGVIREFVSTLLPMR